MEIAEAIALIQTDHLRQTSNASWADLGCGSGLFTTALAHNLGQGSTIFGVDKSPVSHITGLFPPEVQVQFLQLDFVEAPLPFQQLNGFLLANSLHYVANKQALILKLLTSLSPEGQFLIVEYDTDKPTHPWVPYPLSFKALASLFNPFGYTEIQKLGTIGSIYSRSNIYAALVGKPVVG